MTVDALLAALEEGFDGSAWHGPNLQSALRGVRADEAAWKAAPERPSIREHTVHCAFWKAEVTRRVTGEGAPFPREGTDWPPVGEDGGESAWRRDRALLRKCHTRLMEAVRSLTDEQLDQPGPGQKRPRIVHLRGIAFHDVYHAGQIRLLRKLHEGAGA